MAFLITSLRSLVVSCTLCFAVTGMASQNPPEERVHQVKGEAYSNTLNKFGVAWKVPSLLSELALDAVEARSQTHAQLNRGAPWVLDIGTAFGTWALMAAQKGGNVHAIDLDQRHLDVLNTHAREMDLSHRITSYEGPFPDVALQWPKAMFSIAHMAWVLHFMSGEQALGAAQTIYNLLAPGGQVFVSVAPITTGEFPGLDEQINLRKLAGLRFPGYFEHTDEFDDWTLGGSRNVASDTYHFFETATLHDVFESAGFVNIKIAPLARPSTNANSPIGAKSDLMLIAEKPMTIAEKPKP